MAIAPRHSRNIPGATEGGHPDPQKPAPQFGHDSQQELQTAMADMFSLAKHVSSLGQNSQMARVLSSEIQKLNERIKNQIAETARGETPSIVSQETKLQEIAHFANANLALFTNSRGDRILKLEEYFDDEHGNKIIISREVPTNVKTGAVDSKSEIGGRLLRLLFEQSARQNNSALIFLDVNHLGKVNYFNVSAMQGGDEYLRATANVIKRELRANDLIFSPGGDEFLMIVRNTSPADVMTIEERLVTGVDKDRGAKSIFHGQLVYMADIYRQIRAAKNLGELPEDLLNSLSPEQIERGLANFPQFVASVLNENLDKIKKQATVQPSISIGATMLSAGDQLETARLRAEQQAAAVKVDYKNRVGIEEGDLAKYGRTAKANDTSLMAKPRVLPPVIK